MLKKRIDWIDVAKGIAIILMIIGHTIPYNNLIILIFSFHMPLFVILSGITYKPPINKENLKINFKKYFKKLFLPYAIVLLTCTSIRILINYQDVSMPIFLKEICKAFLWGNGCDYTFANISFTGIGPIWFLITLFLSKITFDMINYKFQNVNLSTNIIIYSFLLLLGIELGQITWLPQGLDLVLVFLFYLNIGHLFKNNFKCLKINKNIIFIISFIIWNFCIGMNMYIELAMRSYPLGIISVISSLCGSYCIIELSKIIVNSKKTKKFFVNIGIMSLTILCVHSIEDALINWKELYVNLYFLTIIRVIVVLIISFTITLINKKIKNISNKTNFTNLKVLNKN